MENSVYLGISKQIALQNNMDIIANNVANMNTPGYRAQHMLFDEYIAEPDGQEDPLSFVISQGQYDVTTPGTVSFTGNQMDLALDGPGFFGARGPGGEIVYTRAGNLQLDPSGTLITPAGFPVVSAGGAPILLPQGSTEFRVNELGFVSNQNGIIGQMMVVEFANLQALQPIGNNFYRSGDATQLPQQTRVKQGALEGSNVQPIFEMTRMIESLRAFQNVQNMLETENERLLRAIDDLSKVS